MMIAAATLLSCTSTKDNTLAYFKDLAAAPNGALANAEGNYPIRIQPDDELVISVTSSVPQASAAYNMPMDNPATRNALLSVTQPRTQTYIVDEHGYIMMPVLGRLQVGGKTIPEITRMVTDLVSKDVKDPFVRVDIVNFGIDVLGEVKNPHRVVTGQQYFTVLDALATCGDLTEFGKRDRVYVIRTEERLQALGHLDRREQRVGHRVTRHRINQIINHYGRKYYDQSSRGAGHRLWRAL